MVFLVLTIVYIVKFRVLKSKIGTTLFEIGPDKIVIVRGEYDALIGRMASLEAITNKHKEEIALRDDLQQKALADIKASHQEQINALEKEKKELNEKLEELQQRINSQSSLIATLETEKSSIANMRAEDEKRFEKSSAELEHRLNSLGEKLLKERTESLEKLNKDNVASLLAPLKTELTSFRELVTNTQKASSEQAGEFKNELQRLQNAQATLSQQAENLTNALLKGGKSQGTWGEQQLERVLDLSGLQEGVEYFREVSKQTSEGKTLRIDAWIKLPNKKGILIDAKTSLTDYTSLVNAEIENNEEAKAAALEGHIKSIESHIKELETKEYQKIEDYGSPDFIFMFVPIDYALTVAMRSKPELYENAHFKRIYLVSPSTLVPALRMVSELWLQSTQNDKMKKLVDLADRLYTKSNSVVNHMRLVADSTRTLSSRVENLQKSLETGNGSLYKLTSNFAANAPALSAKALKELEISMDAEMHMDKLENSFQDAVIANDTAAPVKEKTSKNAAKNAPSLALDIKDDE